MHLAYVPRSGRPNPCFQALQQQGAIAESTEEIVRTVPADVAGMRLEALPCEGPRAPPRREVDLEEDKIEEQENLQLQRARDNYTRTMRR